MSFPSRQRKALRAYLDTAVNLKVEIEDVSLEPRGAEVAVSYRRRDSFVDRASGTRQRLEVRLTKTLVREGGKWKITGGG